MDDDSDEKDTNFNMKDVDQQWKKGIELFKQKEYNKAENILTYLLINMNPEDHRRIIILNNLAATLKRLDRAHEIDGLRKQYTPMDKKSPPSPPPRTKQSNNDTDNTNGGEDKTFGQILDVSQLKEDEKMKSAMLLSQCDEMGLGVILDDCIVAMQSYGWNAERALDALLNGMRAPPPPPRAKAFDVDEEYLSVRVPDTCVEEESIFLIVFDDGTAAKCKCPPLEQLLKNNRVIRVRHTQSKKNGQQQAEMKNKKNGQQNKKERLINVKALEEDDESFTCTVPEEVHPGEKFTITFQDGTVGTLICPSLEQLKRMSAAEGSEGSEGSEGIGTTKNKSEEHTNTNQRTIRVRKRGASEPLPKYRTGDSDSDSDYEDNEDYEILSDEEYENDEDDDENDEKAEMKRLMKKMKKNAPNIWLHPENTPPWIAVGGSDESLENYVHFKSLIAFQQRYSELYPIHLRVYHGRGSFQMHQVCQMLAFNYAAHSTPYTHRKEMRKIVNSIRIQLTQNQQQASQANPPTYTRHLLETLGWHQQQKKKKKEKKEKKRETGNDIADDRTLQIQHKLWDSKVKREIARTNQGSTTNQGSEGSEGSEGREGSVGSVNPSRDWSINPYICCGPATNCCGAPMLVIGQERGKESSCERPCLYVKNPFQLNMSQDTVMTVKCFVSQQHRSGYEKRKAITKVMNKSGPNGSDVMKYLPCLTCGQSKKECSVW
jgi:hypothetical protein